MIMMNLLQAIQNGFPDESRHSSSTIPFWQYRYGMYECDRVILFNDRVVVLASLRQMVLQALLSALQGVNTISIRARSTIFWPGMTEAIKITRARCQDCNSSALSQAPIPTTASVPADHLVFSTLDRSLRCNCRITRIPTATYLLR